MRVRNTRRLVRWAMIALLMTPLLISAARSQDRASSGVVMVAKIDGPILPPTKSYLERVLREAEAQNAVGLIIEMNTPGGLLESTRQICQLNLAAKVPVIVYVTPPGARAASAGAIIGLSAHILAMAPGTNIGAAHPVSSGGNIEGDMRDKVTNDTAAFARTLAEKRGKSISWAEEIIRRSASSSETEAYKLRVADIIAADRGDLLRQLNGRRVQTADGVRTLATMNVRVDPIEPTWFEAFLLFLCNPNVALILGAIAMYGIITEISNPGAIFPGVAGVFALILSLYAMSVLSINAAGVALLLLALVLFVIDIYATTHGVLTVGGIIAFIAGALMLFGDTITGGPQVSLSVVVAIALVTAAFFGTIVASAWRTRLAPPGGGPEQMIGMRGEARTEVNPEGKVFADGAFWNALNVGTEPIHPGDTVIIEARDGLMLKVRRAAAPPAEPIYKSSASPS
jgi:membrane-bound serine protease (ClpP class)